MTPDASATAHRPLPEDALILVCREILGLTELSGGDHFAEVGGFSLEAMRVVHRLRQEYGYELPATALLRNQNLTQAARQIASL